MNSKAGAGEKFATDVRKLPHKLRHGPAAKLYRAAIAGQKAVDQAEGVLVRATKARAAAQSNVDAAEKALVVAQKALADARAALP